MAKPVKKRKNLVADVLNSDITVSIEKNENNLIEDLSSKITISETVENKELVSANEIFEIKLEDQVLNLQNELDDSHVRYLDLSKEYDDISEKLNQTKLENQTLKNLVNDLNFEIKKLTDNLIQKDIEISNLELSQTSIETNDIDKNIIKNTQTNEIPMYNINTKRRYVDQAKLDGYDSWN